MLPVTRIPTGVRPFVLRWMFGAGLQGTSLSIRAEGPYLHASVQGVLRIPTGIWPFVLCQMPGSSLQGTSLSIRAEGPYLHPVFQCFGKSLSTISAIIEAGTICRYVQRYQKRYLYCAPELRESMLSAYEKLFSTVEVSQFKNKLRYKTEAEEHKTALRMKHTSACTIEDLKEFHANKRVVNQLVNGDDNSDRLTENDVSEGELDEKHGENGDCAASAEENRDTSMKMGNEADYAFVERLEHQDTSSHTKYWILSSGTNVQEVLANYVETIPESQKCSNPVYWGILDLTGNHPETKALFSIEDWVEMVKSFHQDVKLSHAKVSDAICRFFDEVHKIVNDGNYQALAFDRLMLESIAKEYGIALTADDKRDINTLMLAIMTYAENLGDVDLPVSEAAFDNSFPNMLTRRFLDRSELKMDVGEICWASAARRNQGRSVVLRARVGQKCDFRGSLKHSNDKLEAIVGLRSGCLPEVHRKKVFEDHVDLAVTMRDILHGFFASNTNAPDDELHRTFVLGVQSWGWVHYTFGMDCRATNLCRFGLLATTKLPATVRMLATLEAFYVLMLNVKQTLKLICDHTNDIILSHSRAHRKRQTEDGEEDEVPENREIGGAVLAMSSTLQSGRGSNSMAGRLKAGQ
ncbi:hypothetical protein BC937DRAFT_87215 [Endogone sp. FLAS-F59071]|nr:hypothetical protein BC937DRAFT_87215 [Endogone sp. FLAS-F59071]|eukprot:RUS19603.1 hypothetical protein BC937DRAFT_87215 [Endogone sp. FLAS-F59071]